MLPAVRQKIYPFAFGVILFLLLLLNGLIASPVFAGECAATTTCG